jgi:hypothetical protein
MRKYHLVLAMGITVGACAGDGPTTPTPVAPSANHSYGWYPGSRLPTDLVFGKFTPLNCTPRVTYQGSAVIGPEGGVLQVGPHRLIVPAGALTGKVLISGTVPEGRDFEIDLQPHGLQFKKAAGLILDTSSCTDVPTIIYVVDQIEVGDLIPATYSTWWRAFACPIWHFSGYMIALGDNTASNEIGAH